MAKVPDVKRINKEDFAKEMQSTIETLAYPINSFMEQTKSALDGNLDFRNFNQEIINIDVTTDADGIPNIITQYKSNLKTRVIGHTCISALNKNSPLNTPTGTPFITYVLNTPLIRLTKVTNLQANEKYTLTLISIGASSN